MMQSKIASRLDEYINRNSIQWVVCEHIILLFINPIIVDYVGIVFTSEHTEREKCDTIESIGVDSEQKGVKVHSYGSIFKLTVKSRAVLVFM